MNENGIAFSIDAAFALVLSAAAIFFFITVSQSPAISYSQYSALVDDALYSMESSGYIVQTIDSNSPTQTAALLRSEILSALPQDFDANVTVKYYEIDETLCSTFGDFSGCFPDANVLSGTASGSSQAQEFISGSKTFLRKQPPGDCNISYAAFAPPSNNPFRFNPAPHPGAAFDGEDINATYDVNVSPSTYVACDQNVTIGLSITVPEDLRKPIDMMLVMDRSGSMSWDGALSLSNGNDVDISGNYAYVADGSAGLRVVDVSNPADPILSGTYNSPGTAYGVDASGNYAYVADGGSGLRIVNITNPASPSSAGSYNTAGTSHGVYYTTDENAYVADSTNGLVIINTTNKSSPALSGTLNGIGDARDVFVSGNYAYVATTSNGSSNKMDFNISTGTQNVNINVGQDSSNNWIEQSFVPASNSVIAVSVYIRTSTGTDPPNNLTVNLRETGQQGNVVATGSIARSAVPTSYTWMDVNFSSDTSLDPTQTYYLELTTSGTNSSRYYQWAATNTDPYASGTAYIETTAQSNTDAYMRVYHRARIGLQAVDITNPALPVHKSSATGTDPHSSYVAGNYAYFADGSAGLKIVDITSSANIATIGSYNTQGTASDVKVYTDNNAYIADDGNMLVVNVTTPSSPVFAKSYYSPYGYNDIAISNDWAFLTPGNSGFTTFNIYDGPKMDQAILAAKEFVDFNGWKLPPDQMGLVSFSTSATLDENLTSDGNAVKDEIEELVATGSTYIGLGISTATTELNSIRHNTSALKFQVMLTDGVATDDPTNAAQTAADNGIIIYTIGFGGDVDDVELTNIADITGGEYLAASDLNALQDVFLLIAQKVSELANDANVIVPIFGGTLVVDDGNSVQTSDGNLLFNAGTIDKDTPFYANYILNFPCSNQTTCTYSAITFPGTGAKFVYYDNNGDVHSVDYNKSVTLPFYSRDLNVGITSGTITGSDDVSLDIRVQNIGQLDANETELKLYLNDTNTAPIASFPVPALCSLETPGCTNFFQNYSMSSISEEGVIYARINDDNALSECPIGNTDVANCYSGPKTQVWVVNYTVWRR